MTAGKVPHHPATLPGSNGFDHTINALRAFAVMIVVLFHFGIAGFGFGFVGVDIFLVISGYLMTAIILGKLEQDRFSLIGFYSARFARIYPALGTICIVAMIAGYFLLTPDEYRALAEQATSTALLVSNILFWRQEGYFSVASEYKFLLHTWSIAVEWQFYLLYPILLVIIRRIPLLWRNRLFLLWATLVLSAVLCILVAAWKPSAGFYMLPTRMWEMLAGGLAFLHRHRLSSRRITSVCSLVGGFLLILCAIPFHHGPWPGIFTFLPVAGTALVIGAGFSQLAVGRIAPVYYTGLWSYSIYLWHWPIIVAMRYTEVDGQPVWIAAGLVLSVLMGFISWRYIEMPSRRFFRTPHQPGRLTAGAALLALPVSAGVIVMTGAGLPGRVSTEVLQAEQAARNINPDRQRCLADFIAGNELPDCTLGNGPVRAIVAGDSHADAIVTAVAKAAGETGSIRMYGLTDCPTTVGAGMLAGKDCGNFNRKLFGRIQQDATATPLVIINWTNYRPDILTNEDILREAPRYDATIRPYVDDSNPVFNGMATFACAVASRRPVYMLRPVPLPGKLVPRHTALRLLWTGKPSPVPMTMEDYQRDAGKANAFMDRLQEQCGIIPIETYPAVCADNMENCDAAPGGIPLYFDDNHLNETGNRRLVNAFSKALAQQ